MVLKLLLEKAIEATSNGHSSSVHKQYLATLFDVVWQDDHPDLLARRLAHVMPAALLERAERLAGRQQRGDAAFVQAVAGQLLRVAAWNPEGGRDLLARRRDIWLNFPAILAESPRPVASPTSSGAAGSSQPMNHPSHVMRHH